MKMILAHFVSKILWHQTKRSHSGLEYCARSAYHLGNARQVLSAVINTSLDREYSPKKGNVILLTSF